jgi:hypothetical protein
MIDSRHVHFEPKETHDDEILEVSGLRGFPGVKAVITLPGVSGRGYGLRARDSGLLI